MKARMGWGHEWAVGYTVCVRVCVCIHGACRTVPAPSSMASSPNSANEVAEAQLPSIDVDGIAEAVCDMAFQRAMVKGKGKRPVDAEQELEVERELDGAKGKGEAKGKGKGKDMGDSDIAMWLGQWAVHALDAKGICFDGDIIVYIRGNRMVWSQGRVIPPGTDSNILMEMGVPAQAGVCHEGVVAYLRVSPTKGKGKSKGKAAHTAGDVNVDCIS